MPDRHVPVLVVGGSLVGLSTSVLLAGHGVPHLLVERHRGTAIHPRAASFHQRTMEIFRSAGLQEAVEQAAAEEFVQNGAIVSVETLTSDEVTYFYRSFNEGVEGLSPTSRLFITQIGLEPLLRDRARDRGAEHLYGTELVSFEQDDDGVTSVIRSRDDGSEQTVRSDYLVAADGAHSPIRQRLGIEMQGRGTFAECVTIYFKADMRELIRDRPLSVVYISHPELLGFFRFSFTGDSGFLAVFSTTNPDGTRNTHAGKELDAAGCAELVRKALGRPDMAVEVDDVQPWTAAAAHAASFRHGRVFLAGDSAHTMPPTGGFGGNTGVADAHDLAWKLAMVADGRAGAGLLDTYDAERRPVGALIAEQAYTRYVLRVDPSLSKDNLAAPLDDASIELGAVYASAAVLAPERPDPSAPPLDDPRAPSGRPGTRAAHLSITRDGVDMSILDVFGASFVLLTGPNGRAWQQSAASQVPDLVAFRVAPDGDLVAAAGALEDAYGIGSDGAVVVRPDGVIAWRSTGAVADPTGVVGSVLQRLLFRSGAGAPVT
ncbi:FAD-dependent monooxygenase [Modestobacter lapidis]|nr:monooxygenase [Modestobacter lapidis]